MKDRNDNIANRSIIATKNNSASSPSIKASKNFKNIVAFLSIELERRFVPWWMIYLAGFWLVMACLMMWVGMPMMVLIFLAMSSG